MHNDSGLFQLGGQIEERPNGTGITRRNPNDRINVSLWGRQFFDRSTAFEKEIE